MKKYILLTLTCIASTTCDFTQKEKQIITSLAPKCERFCSRTIQGYRSNQLRASKETDLRSFFNDQVKQYRNIRYKLQKASEINSHEKLYHAIEQLAFLAYGNSLTISDLWPVQPEDKEIEFIKQIKATKWIPKTRY